VRRLEAEILHQLNDIGRHRGDCSGEAPLLLRQRDMARNTAETDSERSLGTIIKELTEDITTLFRGEIALLKLEVKDTVAKLGGGIGLFAGALFVGLFGLAFLFVTILLVLVRLGVPAWLSALIVTVVLLATAGVLAMMGKKKFAAVEFVPSKSIESIKTDIDSIKTDIAQARSK
jgi:uncharacterized membrane protein YqjE